MTVDKFGRHSDKATSSSKGPKGEGFEVTSEGDYDIKEKHLRNVGDPESDNDAVNLKTLNVATSDCLKINSKKRKYDARGNTILNLKDPEEDSEPVTKKFLMTSTPKKLANSYSVHQFRVQDVAYPVNNGDAVNLIYVNEKCVQMDNVDIDAKQRRIINVNDPVKPTDAVNKRFIDKNTPTMNKNYWSFGGKRLVGVRDPIDGTDAVNLRTLTTQVPRKQDQKYMFGNLRLGEVADPVEDGDVITIGFFKDKIIKPLETAVERLKTRMTTSELDIIENRKRFERQLVKFSKLLYPYLSNGSRASEVDYIDWTEILDDTKLYKRDPPSTLIVLPKPL